MKIDAPMLIALKTWAGHLARDTRYRMDFYIDSQGRIALEVSERGSFEGNLFAGQVMGQTIIGQVFP